MRSFRHTWRRHTCKRCFAVFTTRESVDMSQSYRIELNDGSLVNFSRDKLYLSIYDAVIHRSDSITESSILTDTIVAAVQKRGRLLMQRKDLIEMATTVLRRFDKTAYVRYVSLHR
jgi:transcriptional regulator NrdR family protein